MKSRVTATTVKKIVGYLSAIFVLIFFGDDFVAASLSTISSAIPA